MSEEIMSEEELIEQAKLIQNTNKEEAEAPETTPEPQIGEPNPELLKRIQESEKKASLGEPLEVLHVEDDNYVSTTDSEEYKKMLEERYKQDMGNQDNPEQSEPSRVKLSNGSSMTIEKPPSPSAYSGPGLVIDNTEIEDKDNGFVDTGVGEETLSNVDAYIASMESEFKSEEAQEIRKTAGIFVDPTLLPEKERVEAAKNLNLAIEVEDPVTVEDEGEEDELKKLDEERRRTEEGIVIIEKLNSGNIDFSEEEKQKIKEAKEIRVVEVETRERKITRSRRPKNQMDALRKLRSRKQPTVRTFMTALPASGYSVTVKGASPFELMTLQSDEHNALNNAITKWSFVHDKIVDTSLGKMSYDEFTKRTYSEELDTILYAIMCATFKEKETLPLACQADGCDGTYEVTYDTRHIIDFRSLSDRTFKTLEELSNSDNSVETSMDIHNRSLLREVKKIVLPESGYIVTFSLPSASRFMSEILTYTSENEVDPTKGQALILSSHISSIQIPEDPTDANTEYYEFTEIEALIDIVYELSGADIMAIGDTGDEFTEGNVFRFGIRDTECPKCKQKYPFTTIPIQDMLFHLNIQSIE